MERFRQPEYTGENRCMPCTVVNVAIAISLAVLILTTGILLDAQPLGLMISLLFLIAATLAIWIRGYLVPGTPTLTRRYAPAWFLARFGKEPTDPTAGTLDLLEADLLEPGQSSGHYRLTAEAANDIAAAREVVSPTDIDRFLQDLASPHAAPDYERTDGTVRANRNGTTYRTWDSTEQLETEIAIAELCAMRLEAWDLAAETERVETVAILRSCYEAISDPNEQPSPDWDRSVTTLTNAATHARTDAMHTRRSI